MDEGIERVGIILNVKGEERKKVKFLSRDPRGCSLPGSSVHGVFQASVLEWVAIPFSRGSSQPRDRTRVCCIVGRRFTV